MKAPSRFITVCTVVGLVVTSIHATNAGSATWSLNPTSNDWKTAANWTPATVPNSATDTATFGNSSITSVNLLNFTTVAEIVFAVGADAFTLNGGAYTTSVVGAGVTNDSGITQTLALGVGGNFNIQNEAAVASTTIVNNGGLIFFWDATTASNSVFTNSGGATDFTDNASAGEATITNNGGETTFTGFATAANSTITSNGATSPEARAGSTTFLNTSNAGTATLIANGGSNGGSGALIFFGVNGSGSPTAASSTLIANGDLPGEAGGIIQFDDTSDGGTARVEVFGNGNLDISSHAAPGMSIGSIEGSGAVFLGANKLTVGTNNLSTVLSGVIQDGGIGGGSFGSLTKVGKGKLTLSNANTYTGGTTVIKGTLLVTNRRGSATGTGTVRVNAGTLGGTGRISGDVIIVPSLTVATLAPGIGARIGKLTLSAMLSFYPRANYKVDLNSTSSTADQVTAKGVLILSNATITIDDQGNGTLPAGTVFTLINNTAAPGITGTFSNLADGSTLVLGSNTYKASYEGGDGNDLTLTVQ